MRQRNIVALWGRLTGTASMKESEVNKKRLRLTASIALTNALLIYTTLLYEWNLFEVALVYTGELIIIMLMTHARILAATRLRGELSQVPGQSWKLFGQKLIAVLISLLMNVLAVGIILVPLLGGLSTTELPLETLLPIGWCLAGFLVSHLVAYIDQYRSGAYEILLSDSQVLLPTYKFWPLLAITFAVGDAREHGAALIAPLVFIGLLAAMAIVDTVLHIIDHDLARSG